jgi:dTDP-4-amino-4,6-dideoxygalactose transaminase
VIEDACQGVGISYKGRRAGTIGDVGAFSFNQYKNLNSGEGGAVITSDDRIFTRARMFHDVGSYTREYEFEGNEPVFAGMNFRVSELTGAVLYAQLPKLDPLLKRLRKRHKVMAGTLAKSPRLRISPHNDPDNAVGLSVIFDKPEEAQAFATQSGVERLIDTGRHVYTNWEPVFAQRTFHERMNPFNWTRRKIEYTPGMCQRTLDILARTCRVSLGPQFPLAMMCLRSRMLLNAVS